MSVTGDAPESTPPAIRLVPPETAVNVPEV